MARGRVICERKFSSLQGKVSPAKQRGFSPLQRDFSSFAKDSDPAHMTQATDQFINDKNKTDVWVKSRETIASVWFKFASLPIRI
jgi:hypothetical protein